MNQQSASRDFDAEVKKYLDPSLEGHEICSLSFAQLCKGQTDLRNSIRELKDYPCAITPEDIVVDSDMTWHEAFRGLSPDCPSEILASQTVIRVFYFGTDDKIHHGQVVLHQALASDVLAAFSIALKEKIPLGSVIPVAGQQFEVAGKWDDHSSMRANNCSAFNYRRMVTAEGVQQRLSLHGLGLALDINPVFNPCYGRPLIHNESSYEKEAAAGYKAFVPENGVYDLSHPGTLHERHPLVLTLEGRGWTWGGRWGNPKDLHHFQKIPAEIEESVKRLRA